MSTIVLTMRVAVIAADPASRKRDAKRVRMCRDRGQVQNEVEPNCGRIGRGKDANSSERDWFVIHSSAAGTDGRRGGNGIRVSKPRMWAMTRRRRRALTSMTSRGRTKTPTAAAQHQQQQQQQHQSICRTVGDRLRLQSSSACLYACFFDRGPGRGVA